jgi:predicted AAA+ superfamily ATPase
MISNAIQVTLDLGNPEVKNREIRGLLEAMTEHNLTSGIILTMNEEGIEEIPVDNKILRISIMPVWKWLLTPYSGNCWL